MVKRVADANDRRNKLVFLTKEGENLKEQLNPWVAEVYAMASEDVEVKNLQNGLALLNKMTGNLKSL